MRYVSFFLCLWGISTFSLKAQDRFDVNLSIRMDTLKVRHYDEVKNTDTSIKVKKIKVEFNGARVINQKDLDELSNGLTKVIAVDYVYTEQKNALAQQHLNYRRMFELSLHFPDIFTQKMTKWRFIEQLGFYSDEEAKQLFHGFVIYYTKITPYSPEDLARVNKDIRERMIRPKDSFVHSIFNRNPHFNRDVIVADFTCSMSPYYLEVLAWLFLNSSGQNISYSFFNDGDGISNHKKIIGRTGGVHQFQTNNLDTIVKYIFETTKTGCSGDSPENDVEAVIKTIEKNPNCKEVILIADNWSDMRDFRIRHQIKKPVRVILCGTEYGINPEYLNLAYTTKGSVHTMDEDLEELFKLKDGSKFYFGGNEYIVKGGRIDILKKM